MNVQFVNRAGKGFAPSGYRRFLRRLEEFLAPPPGTLTILFCRDEEMTELNRTWRGRQETTDVLSFPGGGSTAEGRMHIGDIAISVEAAQRAARRARRPLQREIEMLLAHGMLHLLGFDHETDDGTMMRLQDRAIRQARSRSRKS